MIQLEDDMDK